MFLFPILGYARKKISLPGDIYFLTEALVERNNFFPLIIDRETENYILSVQIVVTYRHLRTR